MSAKFFFSNRYAIVVYLLIILILGFYVFSLDYAKIKNILLETNLKYVYLAVLLAAVSYLCQAISFWAATDIFRIKIPTLEVLEIGFISSVLINVLSAAGIPGQSYRVLTMKREKVTAGDVTAVSIFHSYFNNSVFFLLLPLAIVYILSANVFTKQEVVSLVIVAVLFLILFILFTLALFLGKVRHTILKVAEKMFRLVHRSYNIRPFLDNFNQATLRGINYSRQYPFLLILMSVFLIVDWLTMIGSLGFSLLAFGSTLTFGKLFVGFAVGTIVSATSFIPGGLGALEGSMIGVFTLLGTNLETAVLATLFFRVVYYLIPFGISLLFFGKIIVQSQTLRALTK